MKTIGNITWLPDDPKLIRTKENIRFDKIGEPIILNYTQIREIRFFTTASFLLVLNIGKYVYVYRSLKMN
ncbi:MAG: hypothetical protein ACE5SW_10620 [Nitrososphaeraceae archaeon]